MVNTPSALTGQKHTNMKTLFLDGDMLAYRAAFSNEVETKWDDDVWTLQTDVQASLAYFDDFVEALCKKFNTDEYFVVFSPKTNFRYELFPEYKGNRKGKRKPLALSELITQVRKRHMFMMADNMEADDLIGVGHSRDAQPDGEEQATEEDREQALHEAPPAKRPRSVAVIKPVAMKLRVATSERLERRESPQTP